MATETKIGKWSDELIFKNVCIHATLLPNKKILYWGRRPNPKDQGRTLDLAPTTYTWDPVTNVHIETKNQPAANLFCSGHSHLPDGNLLVAGGHIHDGEGHEKVNLYNWNTDTWSAQKPMANGRWYPSVQTLADGRVFVIAGSFGSNHAQNVIPEIFSNNEWKQLTRQDNINLYPQLYVNPKGADVGGQVFMAGPQKVSNFCDLSDVSGPGIWTTGTDPQKPVQRSAGVREQSTSVMYRPGKVLFCAGGNDAPVPPSTANPPTNKVELIDLNDANPQWAPGKDIGTPRRQHTATVLADGTVLVTGGTRGPGFNDVRAGQPVHTPTLWDPATGHWTAMAPESFDRCYHSTALLLPDARVLSAGGGEWSPNNDGRPNLPQHSLINAQVFSPPYLFIDGVRPDIRSAPGEISIAQQRPFDVAVTLGARDEITTVTWLRLGSVTHCINMNQSFTTLEMVQSSTATHDATKTVTLQVTAPASSHTSPPGHYMLFVLNNHGQPSQAAIVRLKPKQAPKAETTSESEQVAMRVAAPPPVGPTAPALDAQIIHDETRAPVVVGLTPVCPYGLGGCWGGAQQGLKQIRDVDVVRPVPNKDDSVAYVYVKEGALPDIDVWRREFAGHVNGSYHMRGIDVTLSGAVTHKDGQLVLDGTKTRPDVVLAPFAASDKLEWDRPTQAPQPVSEAETAAYDHLYQSLAGHTAGVTVTVSGRLYKLGEDKFSVHVRKASVVDGATA